MFLSKKQSAFCVYFVFWLFWPLNETRKDVTSGQKIVNRHWTMNCVNQRTWGKHGEWWWNNRQTKQPYIYNTINYWFFHMCASKHVSQKNFRLEGRFSFVFSKLFGKWEFRMRQLKKHVLLERWYSSHLSAKCAYFVFKYWDERL